MDTALYIVADFYRIVYSRITVFASCGSHNSNDRRANKIMVYTFGRIYGVFIAAGNSGKGKQPEKRYGRAGENIVIGFSF